MKAEIVLGPDETVEGRSFTDAVHTRRDEEALRRLLAHQRERVRTWADGGSPGHKDVIIREHDPDRHRHLLVVPDTRALLETPDPMVVGFFGRPRSDADLAVLFELEEELVATMSSYGEQGLLSYYDLELVHGSYGNLILFGATDGPARWSENPIHRRAVEISPGNYHEIRLHHGTLSGRLLDAGTLRVIRTRYLDYSGPEIWRAVREVGGPQAHD